jgi:hypothetical protein
MADATVSAEVRQILSKAEEPMSCAEIMAQSELAETTTHIASSLSYDLNAGRVERIGERGAYRYSLTDTGRAAIGAKAAVDLPNDADALRRKARSAVANPSTINAAIAATIKANVTRPMAGSAPVAVKKGTAAKKVKAKPAPKPAKKLTLPTDIVSNRVEIPINGWVMQVSAADEQASRLAGAVLAHWPAPLASMPPDLKRLLSVSLESIHEAD